MVASRNSRSGDPSNLGPTSSGSRFRFRCVNGMDAMLLGRMRTSVRMTSQGHAYARFGLADALSLLFVIREDKPVLYDKAAVRWFAKYAAEDRYLLLRDARELIDLL